MAQSYIVKGTNTMYSRNAIINEANVVFEIVDWDWFEQETQTIKLKLKILTGIKKGKELSDLVTYNPDARMSWKYKDLRGAIGRPLPSEGEPDVEFDLLELVGKKFLGDLTKSKDDKYQNVKYKRYDADAIDIILAEEDSVIDAPEVTEEPKQIVVEDDLPF